MPVSFKTLDLNLLKVFDAVMEERSVLRASHKVALSQSAVSHSLARLREMLDDQLFIRTTTGMQPTARALAMAGMVRNALKSLEAAIELPKFEPATSSRKFTIAANEDAAPPGKITFKLAEENDTTTLRLAVEHASFAHGASAATVAAVARRWDRVLRKIKELAEA